MPTADWHKCHRSKIADYLKHEGVKVHHITGENVSEEHKYTGPVGREKLEI